MKTWVLNFWDYLRASFWFIPSLMVLLSILLSLVTIHLDDQDTKFVQNLTWAWTGGAAGARQMLSTIAGSMMTVTGVTFSITIVALTLAANQFGPRVLRSFIRDRGNQFVLGTFISTFTYSLIVLGRVRGLSDSEFIPYLSITVAVALALVSLGVLIFFIHHVSYSIQAENLIATIATELHGVLDRLFPEKVGQPRSEAKGESDAENIRQNLKGKSFFIRSRKSGYLQSIDSNHLLRIAQEKNLFIKLYRRPGSFISVDSILMEVWTLGVFPGELEEEINGQFYIGQRRTPVQDAEYSMHQLVEVALRALSPSMNDPYTANICVDRLGEALMELAQREMPSAYRYDNQKQLRVVSEPTTFRGMADIAFNQIRLNNRGSVEVILRMLDHITVIGERVQREEDREVLKCHAQLIKQQAMQELTSDYDKEKVEWQYRNALQSISGQQFTYPSTTEKYSHH